MMARTNRRILLASKSPRRRELISHLGYNVDIVNSDANEDFNPSMDCKKVAEFIAIKKAKGVAIELDNEDILLTADTVVVFENKILGKPKDRAEAFSMLSKLSGKAHMVYTGVCLKTNDKQESFTGETEVHFHELADSEINYYIDHFEVMDKAGAYGIQDWIGKFGVKSISGDYYNVIGLPLQLIYHHLKKF